MQLADWSAYSVLATTTAQDAATALAAIIPGVTASGATVTIPTSSFVTRTGGPITETREVRRQIQGIRVELWCPNPALRDKAVSMVDGALAVFDGEFIKLSDGSGGLLKYTGTLSDDVPSKANLWQRSLHYAVEYPTLQTRQSPPILFPHASVSRLLA